jgi:HEAT repeat protein
MTSSLLHQALHEPSFWRATAAVRRLCAEPPSMEQLQAACQSAFESNDEQTRRRAVRLVEQLAASGTWRISFLRSALSDPSWRVRVAAIRALAAEMSAVPDLLASLQDKVSDVRAAAVEVLGQSGMPDVVTPVLARLVDCDEVIRERAAESLARLPLDVAVLPRLIAALQDELSTVRQQAVAAISRLGPSAEIALPALLPLLRDSHRAVRVEVILALGSIASANSLEQLLSLLAASGEEGEAAARALANFGRRTPLVENALLDILRRPEVDGWRNAVHALGQLGSMAGLEELERSSRTGNLGMRRRCVRALAWFPADKSAPLLEQFLRDSNVRLRRVAAASLGRLGGGAVSAIASLLRLLYGRDVRTRRACRIALDRIAVGLTPARRQWLAVLAAPRRGPGRNLRHALEQLDLPLDVRAAFHATCARRLAWHRRHTGEEGIPNISGLSEWRLARLTAHAAGDMGEHAWQIACLWTLLNGTV